MRRLLMLALLGSASLGCASSGGPPPARRDRQILVDEHGRIYRTLDELPDSPEQLVPGSPLQAAQVLVGVYESLGLSVNHLDTRTGQVGAMNMVAPGRIGGQLLTRYVDCGTNEMGSARAATYEVLINVLSMVDSASDGDSRVTTRLTAQGRQRGVSSDPVQCSSSTALEKRIHVLLAERIAAAPHTP